MRQALTPRQRECVRRFLVLLLKTRGIGRVAVGRVLRCYRVEINGKYFIKDEGV